MATAVEPMRQLSTRIPKKLNRRLKVFCVTHGIVLMHFVVAAVEEKLARSSGAPAKRRGPRG